MNGNWTCWAGYTCIGFIKNPAVSDTDDPAPINGKIVVGSQINFSGGYIYNSSEATQASNSRPASVCEVTAVSNKKSKHPYHIISRDGKGVYGWADASKVSLVQKKQLYSITIEPVSKGDLKMIEDICNNPKYTLKYTTKEIN